MAQQHVWTNRRVLITGHTGFKGAWLTAWLAHWGAKLHGYSLPPDNPSLYCTLGVEMDSTLADIGDLQALSGVMQAFKPEVVFHLAAQSLVRQSYADPVGTYATNLMGTVHVLEAMRHCPSVRAAVIVTSDKCYENTGHTQAYREGDRLGGHDPYSSSKACAELAVQAMRDSFLRDGALLVATARAGNVIGGGDWAKDRLVPDAIRAFAGGQPLQLRHPQAVRPWQHVLDALNGYLALAEGLLAGKNEWAQAWNFAPPDAAAVTVGEVASQLAALWGKDARVESRQPDALHEAAILTLDAGKALAQLPWKPQLNLPQALAMTVAWYQQMFEGSNMRDYTCRQIDQYLQKERL